MWEDFLRRPYSRLQEFITLLSVSNHCILDHINLLIGRYSIDLESLHNHVPGIDVLISSRGSAPHLVSHWIRRTGWNYLTRSFSRLTSATYWLVADTLIKLKRSYNHRIPPEQTQITYKITRHQSLQFVATPPHLLQHGKNDWLWPLQFVEQKCL